MLHLSSVGGAEGQHLTWDLDFTKTASFHVLKYPPSFFAFCQNIINTDDKQRCCSMHNLFLRCPTHEVALSDSTSIAAVGSCLRIGFTTVFSGYEIFIFVTRKSQGSLSNKNPSSLKPILKDCIFTKQTINTLFSLHSQLFVKSQDLQLEESQASIIMVPFFLFSSAKNIFLSFLSKLLVCMVLYTKGIIKFSHPVGLRE